MALDLGAMVVAQVSWRVRGAAEAVLSRSLQPKAIIVFIDELHTLLAPARPMAQWTLQHAEAALARGELHCVVHDARRIPQAHREGCGAGAGFQPVFAPSRRSRHDLDPAGLKEKYELHHGVRIADAAIVAAATLSNRYISDRFLPDKAID